MNIRFYTHSSAYLYAQYSIDVIVSNNLFTREDGLYRMICHCFSPVSLEVLSRLLKKLLFPGWSKMHRCKAPEILRSEAYFRVRRNDEG